mmetsp:Transcript_75895/g.201643  ORF Transcript_75895/g.201643 Transcript_75895/m.201643 type:complete len:238 (+) Transcript_75895:231-944(+)
MVQRPEGLLASVAPTRAGLVQLQALQVVPLPLPLLLAQALLYGLLILGALVHDHVRLQLPLRLPRLVHLALDARVPDSCRRLVGAVEVGLVGVGGAIRGHQPVSDSRDRHHHTVAGHHDHGGRHYSAEQHHIEQGPAMDRVDDVGDDQQHWHEQYKPGVHAHPVLHRGREPQLHAIDDRNAVDCEGKKRVQSWKEASPILQPGLQILMASERKLCPRELASNIHYQGVTVMDSLCGT